MAMRLGGIAEDNVQNRRTQRHGENRGLAGSVRAPTPMLHILLDATGDVLLR